MRRKPTMAILILVSIILQSTVCQMISIASIKPNLLIILTVSFGLMRGKKSGMLTGFNALIYLWVGYFSGYFYRIFYDDDIKTPLFLISISDLIYGIVQYGFMFLMRGRIHFFRYLGRVILPEVLYTLILTIVLYRLLYRINQKLSMTDGGGADSFV